MYELDAHKSPKQNTCDILRGLCAPHGVIYEMSANKVNADLQTTSDDPAASKSLTKIIVSDTKRLSYLNALVKLLSKDNTRHEIGFSTDELLCWWVSIVERPYYVLYHFHFWSLLQFEDKSRPRDDPSSRRNFACREVHFTN